MLFGHLPFRVTPLVGTRGFDVTLEALIFNGIGPLLIHSISIGNRQGGGGSVFISSHLSLSAADSRLGNRYRDFVRNNLIQILRNLRPVLLDGFLRGNVELEHVIGLGRFESPQLIDGSLLSEYITIRRYLLVGVAGLKQLIKINIFDGRVGQLGAHIKHIYFLYELLAFLIPLLEEFILAFRQDLQKVHFMHSWVLAKGGTNIKEINFPCQLVSFLRVLDVVEPAHRWLIGALSRFLLHTQHNVVLLDFFGDILEVLAIEYNIFV